MRRSSQRAFRVAGPTVLALLLTLTGCTRNDAPAEPATPTSPAGRPAYQISVDAIRESISKDFEENLGGQIKSVDCPEAVTAGAAFQCVVTVGDQANQVLINIVPKSSPDSFEWILADKAASPQGIEPVLKEGIAAQTGNVVTSVICPPQILLKAGYKFHCLVTIGDTARPARVEITDESGQYRWEYG